MSAAKELAAMLTGAEYPLRLTVEQRAFAKLANLVVAYGNSDDLLEFDGAVIDDVGAWGGATVKVDDKGLIPEFNDLLNLSTTERAKAALRDYFQREGGGVEVRAIWEPGDGYSWHIRTDIPHETFEIVEDGEPFCRGIVFSLADTAQSA